MAEYYVAASKRCEQALVIKADSIEEARKIALRQIKDAGDYDDWRIDEAYVVKHRATANE